MIDRDPFQPGPHQAQHRYTPSDRERDDRHLDMTGRDLRDENTDRFPCPLGSVTIKDAKNLRELVGRDETVLTPERRLTLLTWLAGRIAHAQEFNA